MRMIAILCATALFPRLCSAELLSFDQTKLCLAYANAIESARVAAEPLPYLMAASPFNSRNTWEAVNRVESAVSQLSSLARDSQYLIPWAKVDAFAEGVQFSQGYKSPVGMNLHYDIAFRTAQTLKDHLSRNNTPDLASVDEIRNAMNNFGEPIKIRSICGQIFLGNN